MVLSVTARPSGTPWSAPIRPPPPARPRPPGCRRWRPGPAPGPRAPGSAGRSPPAGPPRAGSRCRSTTGPWLALLSLLARRWLIGEEEPAEDAHQRHPGGPQGDAEAADRAALAGRGDLLGRLAAFDPFDPVLHVEREVAHEDGGDVGDHAPAVLRRRPGQLEVLTDRDLGAAAFGRQRGPDDHRGLAAALLVGAGRVHDDVLGGVVALGDVGGADELHADRPHPDRDPALVLVVAEVLGQLRTGQAGGHLGDVVEELPHLVDRLGDLEVAGDYHFSTALMYASGSFSKVRRQPAQQK